MNPTPHGSKLRELLTNAKLPSSDLERVETAIRVYEKWINDMSSLSSSGPKKIQDLVELLNNYKRYIEIDLIWDSPDDFLFRQRGQIKLDNSIIEEFLPWLVDHKIISGMPEGAAISGPSSAFASAYFATALTNNEEKPGLRIRQKDQDFTLGKPVFIAASFDRSFTPSKSDVQSVLLAYVAAECKTNLDKTMFQEASATAHDLKIAVPASRYFLLCEFLDMTPISTSGTDINEVLILRGKRMSSNIRKDFSTSENRKNLRSEYIRFLDASPIRVDVISRFVEHLESVFNESDPDELDAVTKGYF